jgi:hypothetical protein
LLGILNRLLSLAVESVIKKLCCSYSQLQIGWHKLGLMQGESYMIKYTDVSL